jgi:DNA-binding response OmpR family regulator
MIGRAVVAGLHEQGYAVDWVRDGHEAELALAHAVYDVALLDLGLPRRDIRVTNRGHGRVVVAVRSGGRS